MNAGRLHALLEEDEAGRVIAVDLDFAHGEEGAIASPIPIDIDFGAVDDGIDRGLESGVIGAGLLGATMPRASPMDWL